MVQAFPQVTSAQELADLVIGGQPFAWVRYGNGEWDLVLGRGTRTGSGSQVFTNDLREAMRETVTDHDGKIMAMQNERYLRKIGLYGKAQAWLAQHGVAIDWQPADVLHHASGNGELGPLVRALRNPVFVGPQHLARLPIAGDRISVPERNCWGYIDVIEVEVRERCAGRTVCVSAGPAAKVLIHRLRDEPMQLIDCGSLWDVYCGVISRKYHQNIDHAIAKRNHLED